MIGPTKSHQVRDPLGTLKGAFLRSGDWKDPLTAPAIEAQARYYFVGICAVKF